MKYRIEPKPERKIRFKSLFESDDLDAVKAWIANPPVAVKTRIRGTDGTCHQLTTTLYHDIVVTELRLRGSAMDDRGNVPLGPTEINEVSTVASMETVEGCRQIERWSGMAPGTLTPRKAYDR